MALTLKPHAKKNPTMQRPNKDIILGQALNMRLSFSYKDIAWCLKLRQNQHDTFGLNTKHAKTQTWCPYNSHARKQHLCKENIYPYGSLCKLKLDNFNSHASSRFTLCKLKIHAN